MLASCKSPPSSPGGGRPEHAPSFQELAQKHNDRLQQLQQLYADGVIEIRWSDEHGKHYEQGNMELWLDLPGKTALRVEKFGEVLLWLGSDRQRYWLFDMTASEKLLYVGAHADSLMLGGALAIRPMTMLDLMGLSVLAEPEDGGGSPAVQFEAEHRAWVVQATGSGGPLRLLFDVQTLLPSRIEALGDDGAVTMASTLGRYEPVAKEGVLSVAMPKMAEVVDITLKTDSATGAASGVTSGEVKLAVGQATANVEEGDLARVFDLERLISGLRPDRIETSQPRAAANP